MQNETVTEEGQRFITTWRKEGGGVVRTRQEKSNHTVGCRTLQATPLGQVDEPKELCTETRRREAVVRFIIVMGMRNIAPPDHLDRKSQR